MYETEEEVTMKDLYVMGAGGFGREVMWLAERINEVEPTWNLKGFLDDDVSLHGMVIDDYPVFGGLDYLKNTEGAYVSCAVGNAEIRKAIIDRMAGFNVKPATLIDPSVLMSKRVTVGEGSIICAGTIITVDVSIGKHVIINLDCTLGHDVEVDDFVTMYPSVNISGCCRIGACTELGTGMQILQGLSIAPHTIVGASAAVVRNIEESGVYVGTPTKKIK